MIQVSDPVVIETFTRLKAEEREACKQSKYGCGEVGPSHFRYEPIIDGVLHLANKADRCGGRRFDPDKMEFVGYSHCTCDACF